jgi:hypothetical protein
MVTSCQSGELSWCRVERWRVVRWRVVRWLVERWQIVWASFSLLNFEHLLLILKFALQHVTLSNHLYRTSNSHHEGTLSQKISKFRYCDSYGRWAQVINNENFLLVQKFSLHLLGQLTTRHSSQRDLTLAL